MKIAAVTKRYLLLVPFLWFIGLNAADNSDEFEYVNIQPTIVTNYHKKSSRKPGFIQMAAQLTVKGGKIPVDKVHNNMPLIRDFIVEFLSFTDEKVIKDVTQRKQLRLSLSSGIQKLLKEHTGEPLIEELVITHFMWD